MRQWLSFPLQSKDRLEKRLDGVQWWYKNQEPLRQLQSLLSSMGDLDRLLSKIPRPQCSPRDMVALAQCLKLLEQVHTLTGNNPYTPLPSGEMETAKTVSHLILKTLVEDPPNSCKEEGVICLGVSSELDEVISLVEEGQKYLLDMEISERKKTGIPSLKIRYNSVFGYYIEVTNTHKDKVPSHYLRKQTLAQAERFSTEALRDLEAKILNAQSQRLQMEQDIFAELQKEVLGNMKDILGLASASAYLDVISSLAWLAIEQIIVVLSSSRKKKLKKKTSF